MLQGSWLWSSESKGLVYIQPEKDSDSANEVKQDIFEDKQTEKETTWISENVQDSSEGNLVSIADVKHVVVEFLQRKITIPKGFVKFVGLPLIDDIIMWTLRYFYYYFEIRCRRLFITSEHTKPNQLGREYTLSEVQTLENICLRMLGEKYCNLLMGVDSSSFHHLKGGKAYSSCTTIDRKLYEVFYTFLTDAVWVAFQKKNHEILEYEINRLFRSEEFNFYKPPPFINKKDEHKTNIKKLVRRSPLVAAVLSSLGKEPCVTEGYLAASYKLEDELQLPKTVTELKNYIENELEYVGILGLNRNDFDSDLELLE